MDNDPLPELANAYRNLKQAGKFSDTAASKLKEGQIPSSHSCADDLKADINQDIKSAQNFLNRARQRLGIKVDKDP